MALPKKLDDPVLIKLAQAQKLMQEAREEMDNRVKDPSRSIARTYLSQSVQILKRAANYEMRAT